MPTNPLPTTGNRGALRVNRNQVKVDGEEMNEEVALKASLSRLAWKIAELEELIKDVKFELQNLEDE